MTVRVNSELIDAPRGETEAYASGRPKYRGINRCATATTASTNWIITKWSDSDEATSWQTLENVSWDLRDTYSWLV